MPKSEQKKEKYDESSIGDERDREPVATTSKDPARTSHNMNDLAAFDFNSADEVRQAMKASIYGKIPQNVDKYSEIHIEQQSVLTSPLNLDILKSKAQNFNSGKTGDKKLCYYKERAVPGCSKTRTGRPPKSGPSRKIHKPKYDTMYKGKLSNIVPFKNRRRNYEDSDEESLIWFN